ncbi:hypothetical protein NKH77_03475 [Streptomyces sp. M19]
MREPAGLAGTAGRAGAVGPDDPATAELRARIDALGRAEARLPGGRGYGRAPAWSGSTSNTRRRRGTSGSGG